MTSHDRLQLFCVHLSAAAVGVSVVVSVGGGVGGRVLHVASTLLLLLFSLVDKCLVKIRYFSYGTRTDFLILTTLQARLSH